jgi:transcription initiation factor TFIID subunit TAF12
MTQIEKTNTKIAQRYAAKVAKEARETLLYLIYAPHNPRGMRATQAVEHQRNAARHAAYARGMLCNLVNGCRPIDG